MSLLLICLIIRRSNYINNILQYISIAENFNISPMKISLMIFIAILLFQITSAQETSPIVFSRDSTSQGIIIRISRSELLRAGKLSAIYFELADTGKYKILSYKMSVFAKARNPVMDLPSYNKDEFSKRMIETIQKAPVAAKIFFEYVKAWTYKWISFPPITVIIIAD